MAGILAELLAGEGFSITVVCPKPQVSAWTSNTLEVDRIQARLINAGVALHNNQSVVAVDGDTVTVQVCGYTGAKAALAADSVVLVTARRPNDSLYHELHARADEWHSAGSTFGSPNWGCRGAVDDRCRGVRGSQSRARVDRADVDAASAIRREITGLSADFPAGHSLNLQSLLLIRILVEYPDRDGFPADGRRDAFGHGAHLFYVSVVLPHTFAAKKEISRSPACPAISTSVGMVPSK